MLLNADRAAKVEEVYRKDLSVWPNNGWSLHGLAQALKAQGKDASDVESRFKAVWSDADLPLTSLPLLAGRKGEVDPGAPSPFPGGEGAFPEVVLEFPSFGSLESPLFH